jgi:HlyD family secretion protein
MAVRWISLAFGVLAVAAGLAGCGKSGSSATLQFETVPVERGSLVAKVSASGTLSALVTVQVGTQISGTIQTIQADFNSKVKKGQILATLDPEYYRAAVAMARANLVAAEANMVRGQAMEVDAQRQYARAKELLSKGIGTQAETDSAEANDKSAAAQVGALRGAVEQARAALNQAGINLANTTIASPINGMVISRNVDIGQTVAASLQTPTLFLIAEDLRKMQVETSVAEADIGRLQPGMDATFTVDAYPNDRFSGVIREVRNAPITVQNVVTYTTVIDVQNPDLKFKPGMTANVTVITAQRDNVLRLPNAALRFRPPPEALAEGARRDGPSARVDASMGAKAGAPPAGAGAGTPRDGAGPLGGPPGGLTPDRRQVWLLKDSKLEPARIRIGITDGTATEIADGGLKEGDRVIVNASAPGSGNLPPAMRRGL